MNWSSVFLMLVNVAKRLNLSSYFFCHEGYYNGQLLCILWGLERKGRSGVLDLENYAAAVTYLWL